MSNNPNQHIMRQLTQFAKVVPERPALIYPTNKATPVNYDTLTFAQLNQRTDELAYGLQESGIKAGTKTVLMLKHSEELFIVLIALLKVGAIPVVVDPGMGLNRMLHCYKSVGAEAFIGIPVAHMVRKARPAIFESLDINISTTSFGGIKLDTLYRPGREPFPLPAVNQHELLMIVFTTGSTGPAKGVEYTHSMLGALVEQVLAAYPVEEGEAGLVTLSMFALVDILSGCTAVLAPMDPTRPAHVDAEKILSAIETYNIRHMFGSPALLHRIAPAALAAPGRISSLKTVVCGGAAAPVELLQHFRKALPDDSQIHTTYGATEALPIATVELNTLLEGCAEQTYLGKGVCVGKPLKHIQARIIQISNDPQPQWQEDLLTEGDQVGEVILRGPVVSQAYHNNPLADREHKIADDETVWHRTGDVGTIDKEGRLWLCGRKSETVWTDKGPLFTMQCEGIFNVHPSVYRSALVGIGPKGKQQPKLCIQLHEGIEESATLISELETLAQEHKCTKQIDQFLVHPSFPVDIRHNSKIGRSELAVWAGAKLDLIKIPSMPLAVMAIPLIGWLYLAVGAISPFSASGLIGLWWVVMFLHFVVHPLQIIKGLPVAKRVGHSTAYIVMMTTIFGATYWHALEKANAEEIK